MSNYFDLLLIDHGNIKWNSVNAKVIVGNPLGGGRTVLKLNEKS